uniref:Conserved oligomeric Golgi complex subunit 4 n=1 Tax=Heterorhabditis bacteriophora TaxID=37862 RepID=A0A1I7W8G0_HETBA
MNDVIKTMDQLKNSLEEHIKTVRLNESSFTGTSAVLEYDTAKGRTSKLIHVIKARTQWERSKEALQEGGKDEHQKLYESLAEMQSSYEILSKVCLFVLLFIIYYFMVLRRFIDDKEASSIILNAIEDGLYDLDLCNLFSDLIGEEENPIYLLQKIAKVLSSHHEDFSQYDSLNDNFSVKLNHRIVQELIAPFRGALTTCVLSKINTIDLVCFLKPTNYFLYFFFSKKSGSFRSRVESFKTSIAELIHLIQDVFHYSEGVFGNKVIQVVQHPIDKAIDNFLAKLRGWQYWLDSQKKPRTLDDMISLCAASGQLIFGLQELKNMVETVDEKPRVFPASLSLNIKPAFKWNRGVCDHVLKTAYENVSLKMTARMAEIVSDLVFFKNMLDEASL